MTDPLNASGFSKYISALTTSVVDKAWEASWATRIIFIALFADCFLIFANKGSLLLWARGRVPDLNVGSVVIFAASLCFVAAFFLPALIYVIKAIALPILVKMNVPSWRHPDYVLDRRVLESALKSENSFLLDWYRFNRDEMLSRNAQLRDLSDLLFGCFLIAVLNFCMGYWGDTSSLLHEMATQWGFGGQITLVTSGLFVFSFAVQSWAHFDSEYIYHPPLARDLEAKDKDRF